MSTRPLLKPRHTLRFDAIGTLWRIDIYELVTTRVLFQVEEAIKARIKTFDLTYSRFNPSSIITQMAISAGSYQLPADADDMIALYKKLYDLTGGAVTPLVGELLVAAGYDARYSFQPSPLNTLPSWDDVITWSEPVLSTNLPVWLDFGAAGKGHLVDIIAQLIQSMDIQYYCINAGGDIAMNVPEDVRIGLESPDDTAQIIGIAQLKIGSLCGSAGKRRAWKNYTHIIDPRTLSSPKHLRAVWVTAASTLNADGLTTALYMVDPSVLSPHFDFEYAIVHEDLSLSVSPHFPATFFH
jgi:thiamine biosynthesis lipoprotein